MQQACDMVGVCWLHVKVGRLQEGGKVQLLGSVPSYGDGKSLASGFLAHGS